MNAALAIDVNAALQGASHKSLKQFGRVSGQLVPPCRPQHGERKPVLSADQFRRTIPELIAAALTKRVGPGKAMTVKQLAHALRIDQQTVWKLLNGYNSPSGPVLMALISFFDSSFANEILGATGCTVAKVSDARAEALRKYAEAQEELRRLG